MEDTQFSSVAQSCLTLCDPMNRSTPGLPVHHHLLGFTQTHVHRSVMPSSHLILGRPLLLLPPIPPSIGVFSNESTLPMRWPKYWSFSFSIIPSKEIPALISFRMDWLYLLAVQGILKSLLCKTSVKRFYHNYRRDDLRAPPAGDRFSSVQFSRSVVSDSSRP